MNIARTACADPEHPDHEYMRQRVGLPECVTFEPAKFDITKRTRGCAASRPIGGCDWAPKHQHGIDAAVPECSVRRSGAGQGSRCLVGSEPETMVHSIGPASEPLPVGGCLDSDRSVRAGSGVQVIVLGLALSCWRCGTSTTAIVGLEPVGGDGVATAEAGFNLKIACALRGQPLRAGVGAVKMRHSGTVRSSYLSNGCRSCNALLGGFPLGDAFQETAVNDRLGVVALGRGAIHPALLDAAFERGWMGI